MFKQQQKQTASDSVIKWKGVLLGIGICLALSLSTVWLLIGNPLTYRTRATLPPVRIRQDKRTYLLPECPRYAQLKEGKFFELPTLQEAELSGYVPAKGGDCLEQVVTNRRTLEHELFGVMKPTREMTERRIMNQRQISMESDMQDLQREIESK